MGGRKRLGFILGLGLALSAAAANVGAQDSEADALLARFDRMVQYNLDNPRVFPSSVIDSLMAGLRGKSIGERIAFWAETFHRDGRARYLFGLDLGGYVREGRICDDFHTDCVLFLYRTTELGRSASAREAVQFAYGTRFYGAGVEEAILDDGRVRYDHESHLDYSEDIFRTGIWGRDVTAEIGATESDPGNDRFPAGSISFVPKGRINEAALKPGDLVYFVLDEKNPKGAEARAGGVLVQHLGVIVKSSDRADLIHAAKSPLPGHYEGGKIERVPLAAYLKAIGAFKGILVSRIEEF